MKTKIGILLIIVMILTTLTGCGPDENIQKEKPVVSVSMYNTVSFPEWRTYVENQCPDIHIDWRNNRNDPRKLLYNGQHNNTADIVALRKFEEDTTKELEQYLLDLTNFEQSKEIDEKYIDNFKRDGKILWLPEPGAMDTLIVNVDLFEQYNIQVPTDMDSFILACKKFEKVGIRGFMADVKEPWESDRLVQTFGIDPYCSKEDGSTWDDNVRQTGKYKEDIEGFAKIGNVFEELRDNNVLKNDDLENGSLSKVTKLLYDGKLAMSVFCTDTLFDRTNTLKLKAIPLLGENKEDRYILSYPVFSVGLSKSLEADQEKLDNAKRVLDAMMSKEAQEILNNQGEGLVSYNNNKLNGTDKLDELISRMNPKNNHIRVLLHNSFSSGRKGLKEILVNEGNGKDFAEAYFEEMKRKDKEVVVGTNKKDISNSQAVNNTFISTVGFNNPFASVIAQSVRRKVEADVVLIDSRCASGPLYKGKRTDKEVKAVVDPSGVFKGNLTGKQIKEIIIECVYCSYRFEQGNI